MTLTRRTATLGLLASGLAACSSRADRFAQAPVRVAEESLPTAPNAGWDAWVASYKGRAASRGIDRSIIDRAFAGAGYIPGVIERDRRQTEFTRSLEDYLSIAASPTRVTTGTAKLAQLAPTMDAIEARYGVEKRVFTAIWGMESQYGDRRGAIPVISATSTLAYDGRRGDFFEQQLTAALRILQNGDVAPENMTGSWAGAMGHTQFIPTSYLQSAVDFTGDGRRDIWSDDPTDGLASAAAYLRDAGWTRGLPWGAEVGTAAAAGVSGRSVTPDAGGPSFVVTRNFDVIKRYNNSDNYAIGVGHLSDRITGGPPIQAVFPPDRFGLTKDDRVALQSRLTAAGFDTQGADGVIGNNTGAAIRAYQSANGLAVTGEPSRALLAALGG